MKRYNPYAASHLVGITIKLTNDRTMRLWVLADHLDKRRWQQVFGRESPAQFVTGWLRRNGYRHVRIHDASCQPYEGWVHRNCLCPECGERFDQDGRCTVGCINH